MSGPTSLWFVVWVCFLVRVSGGETEKTAKPGESVFLPCRADRDITNVEWRRGNETVCATKNPDDIRCQIVNPSFMNRVYLTKELKSGNASLILTNVKETDAGKYECYVKLSGGNRRKRNVDQKPLNTINLKIERGDVAGGAGAANVGLVAALIASLLVLVVYVLFVHRERVRRLFHRNNKPAAGEAAQTQQPLQTT